MPALNFGSFMAGFATQAQKIEEESAKIGMELIKEAIEDFREESKDWKSKYNTELKSWETIAKSLKGMFGSDKLAEEKTIAVLKKGKPYALDFIKTAMKVADDKGFNSPADLIKFGDDTLPKERGITAIEWVRSGAPDLSLEAKPFLDKGQFTGMKTGVFDRQIYPEGMGRIERTENTYLDTPIGIRKPMPQAEFTDIYDATVKPKAMSSPEESRFRKQVTAVLASRSSKIGGVSFDAFDNPNYKIDNAGAIAMLEAHVNQIMESIRKQRQTATSAETAPTLSGASAEAIAFASDEQYKDLYDLPKKEEVVKKQNPNSPQGGGGGAQSQAQTGGTITPAMTNSPQYKNIVTPNTGAPGYKPKTKLERRKELAMYLTNQGISQIDAVNHARQVIQ